MLNVKFFVLSSGKISGFEISGHAKYDVYGKDIVCAAVSSVAYMVVNTMTEILKADVDLRIDDSKGYMYVDIGCKYLHECDVLLEGLKMHLLLMEENYPKNLRVSYEEVY